VERASGEVQIQSSNVDDVKEQLATLEDTLLRRDQQHRQCDESAERLKQKLSAAEAKLERLSLEHHSLLVYAVVLYMCSVAFFVSKRSTCSLSAKKAIEDAFSFLAMLAGLQEMHLACHDTTA